MITARCLCESVRFAIGGRFGPVVYCHCTQCRRASGSAFAANADVKVADVQWIAGRDGTSEYEASPGNFRVFCPRCGSPLYSRSVSDPTRIRVRLGALDGDPERRSLAHVWVGSKAPWFEITDASPRFAAGPPERSTSVYHITTVAELRRHSDAAAYAPPSLAREGFVHCTATPATLLLVARDYFGAVREPIVVLAIDPARLEAELRFETAAPIAGGGSAHLASGEAFPHLYGPLDRTAVLGVAELQRDGDAFVWPATWCPLEEWLA
jgi:uncharacterized protein (DUF952 family)